MSFKGKLFCFHAHSQYYWEMKEARIVRKPRIIPAIDIINGKCVRLTQGDYTRETIYREDPIEVAKEFEDAGLNFLHVVDLDGAKAGRLVNFDIIAGICKATSLIVDVGGGIKSREDLEKLFGAGVVQVNIGSLAAKQPDTFLSWLDLYGPEKFILSADHKARKVALHGWQDYLEQDVLEYISGFYQRGVLYTTCTDIDKDGMLAGPSTRLYREMLEKIPGIKLIASGGVSGFDDLDSLSSLELDGIIVGKAIYEGKVDLHALADWQGTNDNV